MVEGEVKEKVVPTAPEPIVEPVVEPLPEPEPIVSLELDEDDREPGGSSPQEVRARKEYRSRKRVEASLAHEREARIAAEARTQALLEQRSKPSTAETPRYTTAQLQEAVDMGKISPIEAADYLAKVNFEEMAAKVLQTERSRIDRENHESQASSILQQYIAEVPWVADKTDPRYSRLEAEYATLTDPNGLYRLPRT
ncbi:MAG: hypothetical protein ACRD5H_00175, partial [Nitrososphaerales archaeon]